MKSFMARLKGPYVGAAILLALLLGFGWVLGVVSMAGLPFWFALPLLVVLLEAPYAIVKVAGKTPGWKSFIAYQVTFFIITWAVDVPVAGAGFVVRVMFFTLAFMACKLPEVMARRKLATRQD